MQDTLRPMSGIMVPNATTYERSIAQDVERLLSLDTETIRSLWNPQTCPESHLPYLAWALSVDLWDPDWDVLKKRSVIASAFHDHKIKGTLAAIERYLDIVDCDLVQALVPPQGIFLAPPLSKEQQDAWLESMPQLRVYLQSRPGSDADFGLCFIGLDALGDGILDIDTADAIYGRFPVLHDRGEVTPLKVAQVIRRSENRSSQTTERASLPGQGGFSFIGLDVIGEIGLGDDVTPPRLFTYTIDGQYRHDESALSLNTVPVGLQPIDVRTTRESEHGNAGLNAHLSDFIGDVYLTHDDGAWLIYDLLRLHDPSRPVPIVDAFSFLGVSRFSLPAYHAELLIDASGQAPRATATMRDFFGEVFLMSEDTRRIDKAFEAVCASKALRDKILVSFEKTRPPTWADGIPLDGSFSFDARLPASL